MFVRLNECSNAAMFVWAPVYYVEHVVTIWQEGYHHEAHQISQIVKEKYLSRREIELY